MLLLDEPLNHVDIFTQELIFHTLERLTADGKAVMVSTHDLGVLTLHFTQTVGVVLVLSLLVTPGAAASMISKRLSTIMALSVAMSLAATVIGFYLSYYGDVASGPAIVLTLTLFFVVAFVWSHTKDRIRRVSTDRHS